MCSVRRLRRLAGVVQPRIIGSCDGSKKSTTATHFSAGFDTGNGRKYRLRLTGQLRDQYDFADEYLGDIRRVSGSLRFDLWEGFFLDSSTASVWEYFPSGELDEVKRTMLVRTTYFLHRDLFIRSFFQRSFHRDTVDLNLLFSYTFGPNNSRFYIAYNEHRADTTEADTADEIELQV